MENEINRILQLSGLPLIEESRLDEAPPSAKRLLPMFQDFIGLTAEQGQRAVDERIEWARETLQKEDRVIWYLRLVLAEFSWKMGKSGNNAEWANKKLGQIAKKIGIAVGVLEDIIYGGWVTKFEEDIHRLLEVPGSDQTAPWSKQTPEQILGDLTQAYDEWKETNDRHVPENEYAEVIIDFGDGFAWYELPDSYCPEEARAMGHCGNQEGSPSDRILSLRRRKNIGGEDILTPYLTFVLDAQNHLTEMKGRGNDKPAPRYHKYIIELLRHEMVEGIDARRVHLPENNFSLADLEQDVADQLTDEKPGLAGEPNPIVAFDKLWEAGKYEDATNKLEELFDKSGLSGNFDITTVDLSLAHQGMWRISIELHSWDTFEDIASDFSDEAVVGLYELLQSLKDASGMSAILDTGVLVDVFELLPEEQLSKMAQESGISDKNSARALAKQMVDQGIRHPFYDFVIEALTRTADADELKDLLTSVEDRIELYARAGYSSAVQSAEITPRHLDDILGEWVVSIAMGSLREILYYSTVDTDDEELDWQELAAYSRWVYDGLGPDMEALPDERMEEYNLSGWENDEMVEMVENAEFDIIKPHAAAQLLSTMIETGRMPPSSDEQQQDLKFEPEIREMKRLAGILL